MDKDMKIGLSNGLRDQINQSSQFKFTFITQSQKLTLEALNKKDNMTYVGQIVANPYVDFDQVKQIIEEGQFEVFIRNQKTLKIKIGPVVLEFNIKQKSQVQKLNETISKMEQKQNQLQKTIQQLKSRCNNLEIPSDLVPLNLPIQRINWSEYQKSSNIKVVGKTVQLVKQLSYFYAFSLLNVNFSNNLKRKQCWALKIKKLTNWIKIGVCSKKIIQEFHYNDQDFKWGRPGHGCYLIHSDGFSYSQSFQQFQDANKSFKFIEGDTIFIEYDTVREYLRFRRNEDGERFEMPIPSPPQNDTYCPCAALRGLYSQVELILPEELLS